MKCVCGSSDSMVLDSRPGSTYVRRRRKCTGCGKRWTTFEVTADEFKAQENHDAQQKLDRILKAVRAAEAAPHAG